MKQNKELIAITGIIGSGKSTVCSILRELGKTTIDCDTINADLLKDKDYLIGLEKLFPDAFDAPLALNKTKLRNIIFTSKEERERLNRYAHPQILKRMLETVDLLSAQKIFVEVPLLIDDSFISTFDRIWIVDAEPNSQTKRIMERDHVTKEDAERMILSQNILSYRKPTVHIKNTGNVAELKEGILQLLRE